MKYWIHYLQLHNHIKCLSIVIQIFESDNIWVLNFFQNLDFGIDTFQWFLVANVRLSDDFNCTLFTGLLIFAQMNNTERTPTKKLSIDKLFYYPQLRSFITNRSSFTEKLQVLCLCINAHESNWQLKSNK